MYEQHVTGDVGFAVRQYWYQTHDVEWLRAVGWPLARGIAAYYAARLTPMANASTPSAGGHTWEWIGVMGPDEYQWPVNNSAYTNFVVKLSLEFAGDAAAVLGMTAPSDWAAKVRGGSL